MPRVLPPAGTAAKITRGSWDVNPVFKTLVELGNLDFEEAHHTFNMGVGMALIVPAAKAGEAADALTGAGERVWTIGEIVAGTPGEEGVVVYD